MPSLKHFYIGIKGVIYNPNLNKVLLLIAKNADGSERGDIPGGRIDTDEKIPETLRREINEEIPNIKDQFQAGKLLNAYRLSHDLDDGLGLMLIYYKVQSDIEEIELSHEHHDYKWISKDEISKIENEFNLQIESGYKEALRLAFEE